LILEILRVHDLSADAAIDYGGVYNQVPVIVEDDEDEIAGSDFDLMFSNNVDVFVGAFREPSMCELLT
jgi:hypothetical protein